MLVHTEAHERAEVVAGAAEAPRRPDLPVGGRPADEIAPRRVILRHLRHRGPVEVLLVLHLCARGVLRRGGEEVPRGRRAVLLGERLERLVPCQWGLRELDVRRRRARLDGEAVGEVQGMVGGQRSRERAGL